VRSEFQERGSWFLLHTIARPHTAVTIKQFLAEQWIPEYSAYSPYLSLPDFFIFPNIITTMKWRTFK
jgi:hypothetical protein